MFRDFEKPQIDQEARQVDEILSDTGEDWRCVGRAKPLSARSVERMARSVLAAARVEDDFRDARLGVFAWLRKLSHPLTYGLAGAAAVVAWFAWLQPMRYQQPIARVMYSAQAIQVSSAEKNREATALKQGDSLVVTETPGVLIEVGENAHILARQGTTLTFLSDERLNMTSGGIWVYLGEGQEGLRIDTPLGNIIANGTVFGVYELEGQDSARGFDVQTLEGKIEVALAGSSTQVRAGQQVQLLSSAATSGLRTVDASAEVPVWALSIQEAYARSLFGRYFPSASTQRSSSSVPPSGQDH